MNKRKILAAAVLATFATSLALASSDKEPKHIPGIFLGYTNANSETEFSYGIEYEYKFSKKWGALS
jgi:hypothetical protein